jgi:hypothetical protein
MGLMVCLNERWRINTGPGNAYFLSGTFSPPTNHPSPPGCHVWGGMLKLPPVKISTPVP